MTYMRKNPEPPVAGAYIPEVGDGKTFVPTAFNPGSAPSLAGIRPDLNHKVSGRVTYVNAEHRWYRVRYDSPLGPQYEGFKF